MKIVFNFNNTKAAREFIDEKGGAGWWIGVIMWGDNWVQKDNQVWFNKNYTLGAFDNLLVKLLVSGEFWMQEDEWGANPYHPVMWPEKCCTIKGLVNIDFLLDIEREDGDELKAEEYKHDYALIKMSKADYERLYGRMTREVSGKHDDNEVVYRCPICGSDKLLSIKFADFETGEEVVNDEFVRCAECRAWLER